MDPIAIFNALYDTKCLKFGQFELRSGLVAPYYLNLRRVPLYPDLMASLVSQVVDKFLTRQSLAMTTSDIIRRMSSSSQDFHHCGATMLHHQNPNAYNEALTDRNLDKFECNKSLGGCTDADSQLDELDEDLEISSQADSESGPSTRLIEFEHEPILCGVPYGAVPLAMAVAYEARLPFLFERRETYGDQQPLMEDYTGHWAQQLPTGDHQCKQQSAVLIEDVIGSGQSILEAAKALEKQNIKLEFVICIVDREENGVNLLLEQAGIHVFSVYKMSAILRVLETTGRISSAQFVSIRKWMVENQFQSIGINPAQVKTVTATKAGLQTNKPTGKLPESEHTEISQVKSVILRA